MGRVRGDARLLPGRPRVLPGWGLTVANHYRVSPKFWIKARRRGWNDQQITLGLYLLTCEHRNLEGLYRLPKPYIAADLGWPARKVEETLATICDAGFAVYDEDAEMVLIPKALKHQAPSTPNQIKGAITQLERIPRTSLWDAFRIACASHCPKLAEAIAMRWESEGEGDADASSRARAGSPAPTSSSSSSSSSEHPQPLASEGSEQADPLSRKRAERARNGSRRRVDVQALAAEEAAAAAGRLSPPSEQDSATWERLATALRDSMSESTFAQWFEPIRVIAREGDTLLVRGAGGGFEQHERVIRRVGEQMGVSVRVATAEEASAALAVGGAA